MSHFGEEGGSDSYSSQNSVISVRTLADKTQIASMLKNKMSILSLHEANASSSACHTRKRPCTSSYAEVNYALHDWYLLATSTNIYPGGPKLSEKAREISAHLGVACFKGADGWLEK